jgi:hypothetical protein
MLWGLIAIAGVAFAQRGPVPHFPTAVAVSGVSPFAVSCNQGLTGRNSRNAAVESWIAVDPRNAEHLIGAWQQDRWSNGGASGLMAAASFDGGRTWATSALPFSRCASADSLFGKASDPWVTVSPDGVAHAIGLALSSTTGSHAIQAARSTDGGLRWSAAVTIQEDRGADVLNDKESLTADPLDAKYVYAIWDRLSGITSPRASDFTGPTYFSRTTDGGATWERARSIFDPGSNAQTLANQILAAPDGTLLAGFVWIENASAPLVRNERLRIVVLRSPDRGMTWSGPFEVATISPVGVSDVKTSAPVRSGAGVPAFAVDAASGDLYCTWQDGRFSGGMRDGIAVSRSTDGGLNWSAPVQVNGVPEVQAFTPAIAAGAGKVAVTYYDFRKDTDEKARLWTTLWRAVSSDGGRSWEEMAITDPFDLTSAPLTDGGYFVGDYTGLAAASGRFLAFFTAPGELPSMVFATARPSGTDRSWNGRTEVNRVALRRHPELGRRK